MNKKTKDILNIAVFVIIIILLFIAVTTPTDDKYTKINMNMFIKQSHK